MWKTLFTILLMYLLKKTGTSSKSRLYYIHKRSNYINISLLTFLYTIFTNCVKCSFKYTLSEGSRNCDRSESTRKNINICHSSRFYFIAQMVIILKMNTVESFEFVRAIFRGLRVVFSVCL